MMKKYLVTFVIAGSAVLAACNSGDIRRNPGKTYAPDMVYSQAYDAYTTNPVTANGLTSQQPVKGTVARGHALPNHLTESDTNAYYAMQSPYSFTEKDLDEAKRLYNIYCGICHGTALDGNGPLFASGKFASMPANFKGENYLNMPSGKMYYAVMYGKNTMGSYASQLNEHDRWAVIAYIKKVQSENGGAPFTMGATTTGVANTNTVVDTAVKASVAPAAGNVH